MRVFGPRNSAHAFLAYVFFAWVSHRQTYIHIYIYIYISREISIEQPSVRLASLAQLVASKMPFCIIAKISCRN